MTDYTFNGDNNVINVVNEHNDEQAWLQIYCAVVSADTHDHLTATACASNADDLFNIYKKRWTKEQE